MTNRLGPTKQDKRLNRGQVLAKLNEWLDAENHKSFVVRFHADEDGGSFEVVSHGEPVKS